MRYSSFYCVIIALYYPICIILYSNFGLEWSDEVLTAIVLFFFLVTKGRKLNKEFKIFISVVFSYFIYSYIISITTVSAFFYDIQQQIKPYIIFYATYTISPHFTRRQGKFLSKWILVCYCLYVVALAMNVLSDSSLHSASFARASVLCALFYWFFNKENNITFFIILTVMTCGLMSMKSKFYGEYIVMIALLFFVKRKIEIKSIKSVSSIICLGAVILYFVWEKFSFYYIEGFSRNSMEEIARPYSYMTSIKILTDYFPFGSGYASFASAAAAHYYSPLYHKYQIDDIYGLTPDNPAFMTDAFYPMLAQFGIVGIVLFFLFWKKRYKQINEISTLRSYKLAIMSAVCLLLESTSESSYLMAAGMGYFMILALCIKDRNTIYDEKNSFCKYRKF